MRLVGDIGGTNARFALAEAGGEPRHARKLPIAHYRGLVDAVQDYLSAAPAGDMVDEAVLAVAGPVPAGGGAGGVAFTNSPWRFTIEEARTRLGMRRLVVVNDLVAQATSLSALAPDEIGVLKPGSRRPGSPCVVMGPGTGLGVAFLLGEGSAARVLPSEAGHATFAPQDAIQADILRHLHTAHQGHVSVERLLSGPGLLAIARVLAALDGTALDIDDPRQVSAGAAEGCALCAQAVRVFWSILGGTAGNLALTLLAGRVVVTGGLSRALRPLLDEASLREGFAGKGRFRDYLEEIPIDQILRPHAGLLGAAVYRQ